MTAPIITPKTATITWPDTGQTMPLDLAVSGAGVPPTNQPGVFSHAMGKTAPQTTFIGTPGKIWTPPPAGQILFDGVHYSAWGDQSAVTGGGTHSRVREVADPLGGNDVVLEFTTLNSDVAPLTPTVNPRSQLVSPAVVALDGTYWESSKVYIPPGSPLLNATSWVALNTPAYGSPFKGGGPVGWGIDYIAGWGGIPDGVYMAWRDDALNTYLWTDPIANFVGRWTQLTWHYTISLSGVTLLYKDRALVANAPVGGIDAADNQGPWTGRLMLYYNLGEFPQATVFHKSYRIATTQALAESGT